jgi:signal peptidase I
MSMGGLLLWKGLRCTIYYKPFAVSHSKEDPLATIFSAPLRTLLRLPGLYPLLAFLLGRRVVVRGWSMHPTLAPGERVLFDRLAYRRGPPRRGDVVLASHPTRPRTRIVKRIVGLPGDRVAVDVHRCWVNGMSYGEPDDAGPTRPPASAWTWTLGDDEWLLMGDAPYASTDSRDFGPVGHDAIHARAWLVYWPVSRMRVVRD